MGELVILPVITTLPTDPERVLKAALEHDLERITLVGVDKKGMFYFASSVSDGGTVVWDFEVAKLKLLTITCPARDASQ